MNKIIKKLTPQTPIKAKKCRLDKLGALSETVFDDMNDSYHAWQKRRLDDFDKYLNEPIKRIRFIINSWAIELYIAKFFASIVDFIFHYSMNVLGFLFPMYLEKKIEAEAFALWKCGVDLASPGYLTTAYELFSKSLILAREISNKRIQGYSLLWLAHIHIFQEEYGKIFEYSTRALDLSNEIGEAQLEMASLIQLSSYYCYQGQYEKAQEYNDQAREKSIDLDDKYFILRSSVQTGRILNALDSYAEAERVYKLSLRDLASSDNSPDEEDRVFLLKALVLNDLGDTLKSLANYEEAKEYYSEAHALAKKHSFRHIQVTSLTKLGNLYGLLEEPKEAERRYKDAIHIAKKIGNTLQEKDAYQQLKKVSTSYGTLSSDSVYQECFDVDSENSSSKKNFTGITDAEIDANLALTKINFVPVVRDIVRLFLIPPALLLLILRPLNKRVINGIFAISSTVYAIWLSLAGIIFKLLVILKFFFLLSLVFLAYIADSIDSFQESLRRIVSNYLMLIFRKKIFSVKHFFGNTEKFERLEPEIKKYILREYPSDLYNKHEFQELYQVLTDIDFLEKKIEFNFSKYEEGFSSLLKDYNLIIKDAPDSLERCTQSETELRLIQTALQLATNALTKDPNQLAPQLWARLQDRKSPEIQRLLRQSYKRQKKSWLRPIVPSLASTRGEIFRSLQSPELADIDELYITQSGLRIIYRYGEAIKDWNIYSSPNPLGSGDTEFTRFTLTADEKYIYAGTYNGEIEKWSLDSHELLYSFQAHDSEISRLSCSQDGKRLITIASDCSDSNIKVWNVDSNEMEILLYTYSEEEIYANDLVSVAPDVNLVVFVDSQKELKVIDLDAEGEVTSFPIYSNSFVRNQIEISCIEISPDGNYVALSSTQDFGYYHLLESCTSIDECQIYGIDINENWLARELILHPSYKKQLRHIVGFQYSQIDNEGSYQYYDAFLLSIAKTDSRKKSDIIDLNKARNSISLIDLATGKKISQYKVHSDKVTNVRISSNGFQVISTSYNNRIHLFDAYSALYRSRKKNSRFLADHEDIYVNNISLSNNNKFLITEDSNNSIAIRDLSLKVNDIPKHDGKVTAIKATHDGRYFVTASEDCNLKVWHSASGTLLHTFTGHNAAITSIAITSDNRYVISGSLDSTIEIWEIKSGKSITTLNQHYSDVNFLHITADGKFLISACTYFRKSNSLIQMMKNLSVRKTHSSSSELSNEHQENRKNNFRANQDDVVNVWDISNIESVNLFSSINTGGHITAISITSDAEKIITASGRELKVWNTYTSQLELSKTCEETITSITVLGKSKQAIIHSALEGISKVWDLEKGQCLRSINHYVPEKYLPSFVDNILSIKNERYFLYSVGNTIQVFDLLNGQALQSISCHDSNLSGFSISDDSRSLISISNDQWLHLYGWIDTQARIVPITSFLGDYSLTACTLSHDGRTIVAGDEKGIVHIFKVESGSNTCTIRQSSLIPRTA